jgi:2-polyprenyl-6-methoxyphenol hydroxylase-like FAD-dependent oxidoreductase
MVETYDGITMSAGTVGAARRPSTPPHIAIAGAGIGGLALAIALKRKGYAPVVLERRARGQVGQEGIFLTLAPNGLNALRGLGLAEAVTARGVVTTGIQLHNENGKPVGLIDYEAHAGAFGAPSVTIRRGTLGEVLLAAAEAEGIDIRFGVAVDGLSETGAGVTVMAGGEGLRVDLLVGADGLRSTVRRLALPHLPSPVFNGLIGSGGIVDVPSVASTGGRMLMTFGRRAFFGYIKQGEGPVYWFDSFVGNEAEGRVTDPVAFTRHLQSLHRDDPLDNRRIVDATPPVTGAYADYDIPSLPQWSTNRVGLMGDAAHAVTPHSGQGASMALEDALVLAACIDAEATPASAFRRFEVLRRKRVEEAVTLGRQGGQQKKAQGWVALRIRDLIMPLVVPLGQKAQERLFAFRADRTPLAQP